MKKYLSAALVSAVVLYGIIMGFSLGAAIATFAVAGLYAFGLWLDHNTIPDPNEEILQRLKQIEDQMNVLKLNAGLRSFNEQKQKY